MATSPSDPPDIIELPPAPNSATDTPTEFDIKANNTVAAQVNMVPQINTANDWVKTTAQQVYDNALEVEDNVVLAQTAASIASSASNFQGLWSELTGSFGIRNSVLHNGTYWYSLVSIADITLSEPSSSNPDWALISAQKWTSNSVLSLPLNGYELITATGSDETRNLPSFTSGDFVVVNLSPESDSNLIIPVSGVTIYAKFDSWVDGDNLILEAGDTLHLAADSPTVLRVI
jgi:hypothetical protein